MRNHAEIREMRLTIGRGSIHQYGQTWPQPCSPLAGPNLGRIVEKVPELANIYSSSVTGTTTLVPPLSVHPKADTLRRSEQAILELRAEEVLQEARPAPL